MGFDVMSGTRLGRSWRESSGDRSELMDGMLDLMGEVVGNEQDSRQQTRDDACGVGAVALARAPWHVGELAGGGAQQRGDVVGKDLGGDVHEQGLLRQTRGAFQMQAVLEALEGFLDAPTLVVKVGEDLRREGAVVEVGGEHAHETIGGDLADQAHARCCVRALEVGGIASAGTIEIDPLLLGATGHEAACGRPAAGVVAAHREADATSVQEGDEPGGRVAAIENEHIIRSQAIQGFEQHLALADLGAVHAGVQGQFGPGQVQREQPLIAPRGRAAQRVAAAHGRSENRCVGGHDPKAAPQRNHPRRAFDEPVIEGTQRVGAQPITCAGEGAIRGHAFWSGLVAQVGEELIQASLMRQVALTQQRRDQGRQRQLAPPGERALRIGPTRRLGELDRVDVVAQIPKDVLDIFGSVLDSY